jgi:hypothetical protein
MRRSAQVNFRGEGTSQHKAAVKCNKLDSTAQHSTAQHSTAQHSTTQHNTAQHSTAQHSTDRMLLISPPRYRWATDQRIWQLIDPAGLLLCFSIFSSGVTQLWSASTPLGSRSRRRVFFFSSSSSCSWWCLPAQAWAGRWGLELMLVPGQVAIPRRGIVGWA